MTINDGVNNTEFDFLNMERDYLEKSFIENNKDIFNDIPNIKSGNTRQVYDNFGAVRHSGEFAVQGVQDARKVFTINKK